MSFYFHAEMKAPAPYPSHFSYRENTARFFEGKRGSLELRLPLETWMCECFCCLWLILSFSAWGSSGVQYIGCSPWRPTVVPGDPAASAFFFLLACITCPQGFMFGPCLFSGGNLKRTLDIMWFWKCTAFSFTLNTWVCHQVFGCSVWVSHWVGLNWD